MKDILLVLSDQHAYPFTSFADDRIETPAIGRVAQDGLCCDRCYCNAPLCVPSRMSLLTGKLPSELNIFNNDTVLPADIPTIAHAFGIAGYHTVLIGRMHFKGDEQKHGFDERLAGDITSQYWGTGGKARTDFGVFAGTTNRKNCLKVVGGGCSPVMAYDEAVFQSAMDYLEKPHEEPPFLVVGFYAPHFPFVTQEEKYQKYLARFRADSLPQCQADPVYQDYLQECTPERAIKCKAAYCGEVEILDSYIGQLYDRFRSTGRDPLFLYTSDHGEQLGKRAIFGKSTLYEEAIHVPLVMAGSGIQPGSRYHGCMSLLDLTKTLLHQAGIAAPWHHGTVIDWNATPEAGAPIKIEQLLEYGDQLIMAEAVLWDHYKAVRYGGKEIRLYDLDTDPDDLHPLDAPEILSRLSSRFLTRQQLDQCLTAERTHRQEQAILTQWGKTKHPHEWAGFHVPAYARNLPKE